MKSTLFRLDPETHKALRLTAMDEGISMNELVKRILSDWLQKRGPTEIVIKYPGGETTRLSAKDFRKGVKK